MMRFALKVHRRPCKATCSSSLTRRPMAPDSTSLRMRLLDELLEQARTDGFYLGVIGNRGDTELLTDRIWRQRVMPHMVGAAPERFIGLEAITNLVLVATLVYLDFAPQLRFDYVNFVPDLELSALDYRGPARVLRMIGCRGRWGAVVARAGPVGDPVAPSWCPAGLGNGVDRLNAAREPARLRAPVDAVETLALLFLLSHGPWRERRPFRRDDARASSHVDVCPVRDNRGLNVLSYTSVSEAHHGEPRRWCQLTRRSMAPQAQATCRRAERRCRATVRAAACCDPARATARVARSFEGRASDR